MYEENSLLKYACHRVNSILFTLSVVLSELSETIPVSSGIIKLAKSHIFGLFNKLYKSEIITIDL